ncbi:hypothetical protein G7069_05495 [Lysobacter sp. HDW10]|uniref:hypothetical protein n=1 Tax=Lysobacter sp. HDW10 TaxID=2714936 RepID=UPI001407F04B|nr:hypothetical protein [Lysobacter sp. HDW10]QIK81096.1 hypothetical protein G7069_05495 [Lysobacter sp. HDW10]
MRFAHLTVCLTCVLSTVSVAQTTATKVANEGEISRDWDVAPGHALSAPGYPAEAQGMGDSVCVALGYRIQPDGSTSDFAVIHNWTSNNKAANQNVEYLDPYARAASLAVSTWRFAPKPGVTQAVPVDTVATFAFKGKRSGESLAAIRAHCALNDVAAALKERRDALAGDQQAVRTRLDRMYQEQAREERRSAAEKRALSSGAYHPNAASKGY